MVLGLLLRDEEERKLVFDFESLLPEDVDDRDDKNGGNDGSGGGASSVIPGVKKDFKRGTVVCRHWLRGLCMKGDSCEFLHQYDMSKMPECRWGMECQVPECPFRHVPDEERVECAFYRQGFCSHGSNCRYRHIKLAREECPEVADFSLQSKAAEEESVKRRKAQPVNEYYKIAICKHWEKLGTCPFGEECHFAHGEKELRPFPKGDKDMGNAGGMRPNGGMGAPNGNNFGLPNAHANGGGPMDPSVMGGAGGMEANVALPDENKKCKYFVLRSKSYHNLADAVHHNAWSVPLALQHELKNATIVAEQVFLYFTVPASRHFQGVARLTTKHIAASMEGEDLSNATIPKDQPGGGSAWKATFNIEWIRVCELPYQRLEHLAAILESTAVGQEINALEGHEMMKIVFLQPPIQLHYKSVEDENKLPGGAEELASRRRQAAESLHGPAGGGFGAPGMRWKVSQPGFVFACNNTTIDECFGRMIFGLASDQEQLAAKHVAPGMPLFLLNMSDRHLLGIFEAVSPSVVNMIPSAFSHAPTVPSPFPVQTRFVVQLNAPPIPTADPQIKAIFGERGVRIGPLTLQVTQRLADIFAERCPAHFFPPPGPHGAPPVGGSGSMRGPPFQGAGGGPGGGKENVFMEKMPVGIENDHEFEVTRRIIGHSGSNMKRIVAEAGGNAKVQLRGRGSGVKEGGEEANEPLVILVSADNERSHRIACEMTVQLLGSIHHDYQVFLSRKHGGHMPPRGPPGGPRGPPMQFQGPSPPRGGPGFGFAPPPGVGGGFNMGRPPPRHAYPPHGGRGGGMPTS